MQICRSDWLDQVTRRLASPYSTCLPSKEPRGRTNLDVRAQSSTLAFGAVNVIVYRLVRGSLMCAGLSIRNDAQCQWQRRPPVMDVPLTTTARPCLAGGSRSYPFALADSQLWPAEGPILHRLRCPQSRFHFQAGRLVPDQDPETPSSGASHPHLAWLVLPPPPPPPPPPRHRHPPPWCFLHLVLLSSPHPLLSSQPLVVLILGHLLQ
ncbi:hypothetical protein S40285_10078 [Stachybotrys chlorohalonatus IBT 40285]|uniref:Uncharacterized protein n=1 Tax=Stachybotrys chlorohalonatus (strain IBT 40285) TaxID=1283841 RepID=A0A084QNJ1_STAC4|nr:hypothetical protein S40285_10078 [Stachybotrys chlorohalonata IBT 40285]